MATDANAWRGILTGILTGVLALSTLSGTAGEGAGDAVEVLVRAESSAAAAAIVDANGGEVHRPLDIVDGVAAAVPTGRMGALLRTAGVLDVTPNTVIAFAEARAPQVVADEAVAAALAANEAADRAEEARRAARNHRQRARDLAKDGDVDGAITAEADTLGAITGAEEAAATAAGAAAIAASARDELEPQRGDKDVRSHARAAKGAARDARRAARTAVTQADRAREEAAKAGKAVRKAVRKAAKQADEVADEAEELRAELAAQRTDEARRAERNAARDDFGITPRDAVALLGGSWLEDEGYDGSGVDIAIVDSGVADLKHLGKRVERPVDLSGVPGGDRDDTGHGTAMASIAGFQRGSDSGVADDVGIIDVKVAARGTATDVSQVIAGIDWVVANRTTDGRNIRVLSLSFGTDGAQAYTESPLALAVEAAWRNGIVVVVAAGNHGSSLGRLAMPAIDPYVIAVGAVDLHETAAMGDDTVPDWSARGDGVRDPDVLAPGVSLLAAMDEGSEVVRENSDRFDRGMLPGSGTSQATAFTAGVVASLLEANPELSPDEVKALLVDTARPLAGVDARAAGNGVIDLGAIAEHRLAHPTLADFRGRQQDHGWSQGNGTLDGDRGTFKVTLGDGEVIDGDETPFGRFDGERWREAVANGSTWTGSTWTGSTWTGSTWTGSTWTGSTWTGSTWTGSTWTGSTWTGSTWTGSTWTGSTWTGSTWTTVSWR